MPDYEIIPLVMGVIHHDLIMKDRRRFLLIIVRRIGKATIYRTLDLLVRSRLVAEHDFGEGFKRYEHRLSSHPIHEHLICLECGKVVEFESNELFRVENRVRQEHGFVPVRRRLEIYGLCKECHEAGVEVPMEGLTCPIETV